MDDEPRIEDVPPPPPPGETRPGEDELTRPAPTPPPPAATPDAGREGPPPTPPPGETRPEDEPEAPRRRPGSD